METESTLEKIIQENSAVLNLKILKDLQQKSKSRLKESLYKCEKCGDTGWILIPQEKYAPLAVSCDCRKLSVIKNGWVKAGINPEISKQTFSSFEVWNEASRKIKEAAIAYYKDFNTIKNNRRNGILFCGQVGSGKSHVSVALALNLLKKNVKAVYMPYRDTITKLKQNMVDGAYYESTISKYKSCEVLLIDDLFKGKITETDINIIFEIINHRYVNHLPIIISTEYLVKDLLNFDEAVGSRIYEMCRDYTVEIEKGKEGNFRLK